MSPSRLLAGLGKCSLGFAAALALLAAPTLEAQVVYSTFGPGDSYQGGVNNWWAFTNDPTYGNEAVGGAFFYGGSGGALSTIRLAATNEFSQPYTFDIGFWVDFPNAGSGTLLESWTGLSGPDGIFTLTSVLNPFLTTGSVYFVVMTSPFPASWGWNWNDQGITGGLGFSFDEGANWNGFPNDLEPAFEVSTVPEPATMTLLATGLAGMAAARRKKRRG